MNSKIIITYFLLVASSFIYNSSQECTGKIAKQRPALFIQAEQYKKAFEENLEKCRKANNCTESIAMKVAASNIIITIDHLEQYKQQLEQSNQKGCVACEKKEAEKLQKELEILLENSKSQDGTD